jgi:UDP-glucose 4-epimerase
MGWLPSIEMFGNDYPTPDGTCERDYVHVSDLAAAHIAAIEWLAAGNSSNSFNLGNGRSYSVAEVIRTTEQVTGLAVKAEIRPRRAGDPPSLISDSTKTRQLLGWKPNFPELRQQIAHAYRWFHNEMPKLKNDKEEPNVHR